MKPQTLFVNTIIIAAVAAAVLVGLGGTDLGNLGSAPSKRDSVKEDSPKPRPPRIANPLPAGGAEGKSGTSQPTETTQGPTGNGLEDPGKSGSSDAPGGKPRPPSKPDGQGEVRDVRKQVSENLKKTLGERSQAQRGSLSVEAYNRKADSLRQTQQDYLGKVIGGS